MARYERAVFIFRRDLRLKDNAGLAQALRSARKVLPVFILDPRQVEDHPYRSENALRFMVESLSSLEQDLKERGAGLRFFFGTPQAVLPGILRATRAQAVFVNRDYTPFSRSRDSRMQDVAAARGAAFVSCDDALLFRPEDTLGAKQKPLTVFSAFYRRVSTLPIDAPRTIFLNGDRVLRAPTSLGTGTWRQRIRIPSPGNSGTETRGGRSAFETVRKELLARTGYASEYASRRNELSFTTTRLSAFLKFGVCSPREAFRLFETIGSEELVRQLFWREFYTCLVYHFPHVLGSAFHARYDRLAWNQDSSVFERWRSGTTGFPVVDAAMRELNQTGFLHNRARLIAASFLVKDLFMDWRMGEKYFATRLVDYDPAVNNGNWQWAASTGCDPVPYFRVFNPWTQSRKFDPSCSYVRRWIPELRRVEPGHVHHWDRFHDQHPDTGYPAPMLDHARAAATAKLRFRELYGRP